MIAHEKRALIMTEGEPVEVYDHTGTLLSTTTAVIGKATKQSQTEIAHEYHRKGIFVPDAVVPQGSFVKRLSNGETYMALANMVEIYDGEVLSQNIRLLAANATATLSSVGEMADENGDITTGLVDKVVDMPIYITFIRAELVQYAQGLHPKANYLVYMPDVNPALLDAISITVGSRVMNYKVDTVDFMSFEGMALVGVCTETRT